MQTRRYLHKKLAFVKIYFIIGFHPMEFSCLNISTPATLKIIIFPSVFNQENILKTPFYSFFKST